MNKKVVKRGLLPYLFLAIAVMAIFYFFNVMNQKVNVLTYDEFMKEVNNGNVSEVVVVPKERAQTYEVRGKIDGYEENESFFVRMPLSPEIMKKLVEANEQN